MPRISALGGMSSRGFGEFAQLNSAVYVEDVFSTYLYNGTDAPQTIANNIDVSTKGGLVWLKSRSGTTTSTYDKHILFDTARGNTTTISTNNSDAAQGGWGNSYFRFRTNGFDTGTGTVGDQQYLNKSGVKYSSWTFRKQPKFFDIVTYSGNGSVQNIAHNLGSVPGCIMVKQTNGTNLWTVYHRSVDPTNPQNYGLWFSSTNRDLDTYWNKTAPTATQFTVGPKDGTNASGGTYVAYLFAHNAGGFGLDGTQNVISCGTFATDSSGNATVNLGWETQFVITKPYNNAESWYMQDNIRSMSETNFALLYPSANTAEYVNNSVPYYTSTSTGFKVQYNTASKNFVYIAIRRGPMKVPTDATKVFSPITASGPITTGFPVDLNIIGFKSGNANNAAARARLINAPFLVTNSSAAETGTTSIGFDSNTGLTYSMDPTWINWNFQRAPSFMDVVCYSSTLTGDEFANISHNLGAVPQLIIIKGRNGSSASDYWAVYSATVGNTKALLLNDVSGPLTATNYWNNTTPTSSVFTVGANPRTGANLTNYIAYLFASCPGVSKVGSYTGTGATQTISCGFTGGARYVLIKRTDSTGDWWVWDTARGMISGTDPRLAYNSTAAETNANWVYTTTGGFQIVTSDATVNASGGSYIYLAIA